MASALPARKWLLVILGGAALLRVALAVAGGQFFFSDEVRFLRSILLADSVLAGDWPKAASALASPQHAGFVLVGALLAPVARGLALLAGTGDWSQAVQVRASLPLIAVVLAVFSVLNVWLVRRVVVAHGGDRTEANLAALLAAVAVSLTYQVRHILPYDAALAAWLAALVLLARGDRAGTQLAIGGLAGACFTLYNGYWFLVPVIGLALIFSRSRWLDRLTAGLRFGLGTALVIGLVMLPGTLLRGADYWQEFLYFGSTVRHGVFAEGWSLPWAFLWHTETWLGLAVLAAIVMSLAKSPPPLAPRVRPWLGLTAGIYAMLAVCSAGLELFVVYGRTVRPLTVGLCLLGGHALGLWFRYRPRWRPATVGAILGLATLNLVPHFRISFPEEVRMAVWRNHGVPKLAVAYSGITPMETWPAVTRPDLALLNTAGIFPVRGPVPPPAGPALQEWISPLSLYAYRYEGYTPRERELFRTRPPVMQLIRLEHPADVPDSPPPAQLVQPEDLPDGYDHHRS